MKAWYKKYQLNFFHPAVTSRETYKIRPVWFLFLEENGITGVGECAPLSGLSSETPEQVEQLLEKICANPLVYLQNFELTKQVSSVHFALEMAWLDFQNGGKQQLFPSAFTEGEKGIPINGLIWMGDISFMWAQIKEKITAGYRCIKLKIGSLDFEKELELLQAVRQENDAESLVLRLDANGAFNSENVLEKLNQLASFEIHSIEQPIAAGQWQKMSWICHESPVSIALDEELTGVNSLAEKEKLLDSIRPQFIVLKPSLHGGFSGCSQWIELAENRSIGWWITSYLESNVGLNAIAQWAFFKNSKGHQGLGTGSLFSNNISSPLEIRGEELWIQRGKNFQFPKNFFDK